MTLLNWPYVVAEVAAAGIALSLAWYAWRRRGTPGGIWFSLLMMMIGLWSLGEATIHLSVGIATKITWTKIEYVSIVSVAPLWVMFALGYTRRTRWLTPRRVTLLWIVPAAVLALAATNEWHRLIWPSITPVSPAPGAMLVYSHGIGVWIDIAYAYTLVLLGTILLAQAALRSPRLYRRQMAALLAGIGVAWIASLLYVLDLNPWPGLELTSVAFALTGLGIAWAIFRFHIFDVVPIARHILVETMGAGVLVLDGSDRVVDANPTALRMIRCPLAQVVGHPASAVLAGIPPLLDRFRDETDEHHEILLDTTEDPRWLDVQVTLLRDAHESVIGRLIVLHDVTAHKQVEATLRQYTHELEDRNAELDAFAHTVAHDLKGPLSVSIGYGDLLLENGRQMTTEDVERTSKKLVDSGWKMSRIIDELLLLSSVRKVEQAPLAALDMGALVQEVLWRFADAIKDARAEVVAAAEWPTVISHGPWLEEVWVNYVSNALKYGGRPPRLELGYDAWDPGAAGSESVRFWVRDNGPGLSSEAQSRLFTEFTRLDLTQGYGHGLGLSIVRRIVTKLGGEVGVESVVGRGSTFYFTLPVSRCSAPVQPAEREAHDLNLA